MSEGREIVFDTETTGLNAHDGDRIIEIGAIELMDRLPTGRHYHTFLDPGPAFQELDAKVTEITGYTIERVRGEPFFDEQVEAFLDFVGDAPLVAHNADFDKGFINAELKRAGRDGFADHRFIDTLKLARALFPGSPASLDALCKRFDVSLTRRQTHGALIDSELLAEVYLHLRGGRERRLGLSQQIEAATGVQTPTARQRPTPLPGLTDAEREAHRAFIAAHGSDMIWEKIWARQKA